MKDPAPSTNQPARTRVVFHALVGALSISSALILRESTIESQRTGALLLLLGGLLFATVVVVDAARTLRSRSSSIVPDDFEDPPRPVPAERTVTRRIRPPRPEIRAADGGERLPPER